MSAAGKKVTAIVQVRMNSGRLPGKSLIDLEGKPLLQRVIERTQGTPELSGIVIATSTSQADDAIALWCGKENIPCYRGSEEDVLDRFYQAGKQADAEAVLRVTADDPLKDPVVFSRLIQTFWKSGADYVSNTLKPTYPEGLDGEVFSFAALEKAWTGAQKLSDREHVTPYIWGNPDIFSTRNVELDEDLSFLRWTVDYLEDLEFARAVYRHFAPATNFGMKEILELLEQKPRLKRTNRDIPRNEGYLKSLQHESP